MQTRRVGRTTDIALRVNEQTKREIGSVQKQIEDVSNEISELKDLMQQYMSRSYEQSGDDGSSDHDDDESKACLSYTSGI